jgi:enamine deaminase RidA (YjgF/YER057c/UK114 family)
MADANLVDKDQRIRVVQPGHFPPPKGYANGIVAQGRMLFVAGQVGWDASETIVSDDIGDQFIQAVDNVLEVVRAAGGRPGDVVQMTVFVTDVDAYVDSRSRLREAWRKRFGDHYPAMALIGIARLFESGAKVEIQAVAALPE